MSDGAASGGSAESSEPLAGERLAAARRDQEISIRDIAKELHLDEARVQALEQNKFETLGAPVFAKGYLRKYADLVGVPIEDILTDYYRLNRSVGAPPVVGPPRKTARDIDLSRWILPAIVALVLIAVFLFWLQMGSPLPSLGEDGDEPAQTEIDLLPARDVAEPVVIEQGGQTTVSPLPAEEASAPPREAPEIPDEAEAAAGDNAAEAAPAPQPEPEPATPVPTGPQVRLTLSFDGDCWTEVTDAGGARLFFDLGRAGREVTVSGTAPLRVLFGDYANVSLRVDGERMPIPRSGIRGQTARFSINPR